MVGWWTDWAAPRSVMADMAAVELVAAAGEAVRGAMPDRDMTGLDAGRRLAHLSAPTGKLVSVRPGSDVRSLEDVRQVGVPLWLRRFALLREARQGGEVRGRRPRRIVLMVVG